MADLSVLPDMSTVRQVADFLTVSVRLVYAEVERGRLSCVRVGSIIRIPRRALEEYLATNTQEVVHGQ